MHGTIHSQQEVTALHCRVDPLNFLNQEEQTFRKKNQIKISG